MESGVNMKVMIIEQCASCACLAQKIEFFQLFTTPAPLCVHACVHTGVLKIPPAYPRVLKQRLYLRTLFQLDDYTHAPVFYLYTLTGIPGRGGWAQSGSCRGWLTSSRAPSHTRSASRAEPWSGPHSVAVIHCCSETPGQDRCDRVRQKWERL